MQQRHTTDTDEEFDDEVKIKNKVESLNSAAMKLGEMMYKESQEQNANAQSEPASKDKNEEKDADVVDADFEEVKPDDKNEKSAN